MLLKQCVDWLGWFMARSEPLSLFPIYWARTIYECWSFQRTATELWGAICWITQEVNWIRNAGLTFNNIHLTLLNTSPFSLLRCREMARWKCSIWNAWAYCSDIPLSLRAGGLCSQHKPNPPGEWACVHLTLGWGRAALGYSWVPGTVVPWTHSSTHPAGLGKRCGKPELCCPPRHTMIQQIATHQHTLHCTVLHNLAMSCVVAYSATHSL